MGKKLNNIGGLFANSRSRLILLMTVVVIVGMSLGGYFLMRQKVKGIGAAAHLSGPPGIQSIPGSEKATARYIKIQEQQNQEQAVDALHSGHSALPTILQQSHFDMTSFNSAKAGYGGRCDVLQTKYPYCFLGALPTPTQQKLTLTSGLINRLSKIAESCSSDKSNCVCQRAMNEAVSSGEMTVAQSKTLLLQYGKTGPCAANGDHLLQSLVANGTLSSTIASQIKKACHEGMPRAVCEAVIQRLVAEGKLNPALAKRLEAAYGSTPAELKKASAGDKALAALFKSGAITESEAADIGAACHKGVSKAVCHAEIQRLLAEGKLTPAQADKLLKAYAATATDLAQTSSGDKLLGNLLRSGKLSSHDAAAISKACAPGELKSVCRAEIQRLLKEGKLTPAEADKLMHAFAAKHASNETGEQALKSLVSNGKLTAHDAAEVATACKPGMPRVACAAAIQRLLAEGKLTPAEAQRLGELYGATQAIKSKGDKVLAGLLEHGGLSNADAAIVENACKPGMSREACAKAIQKLAAEGKLTSAQAKKLLAAYNATAAANALSPGKRLLKALSDTDTLTAAQTAKLEMACKPGMPRSGCAAALRALVESGDLTPAQARKLLKAYGAMKAAEDLPPLPPKTTVDNSAVTNIPGNEKDSADANLQRVLAQQNQYIANQQQQQEKQTIQQDMSSQAAGLFSAWAPQASQTYVAGDAESGKGQGGSAAGVDDDDSQAGGRANRKANAKAGVIDFGVLETAVNSDQPGPVMAKLVEGQFKGAKLLGTLSREKKRVVLRFNTMNLPSLGHSIKINAVAIDPNTARTALASHVNSHYLLRYGTLFASAFLTGYGQAVQQSGSTTVLNGLSTQVSNPALSPKEEFVAALGQVGQQWGDQLQGIFNTPPTVTVASGTGVGVLFLDDIFINQAGHGGLSATEGLTASPSPAAAGATHANVASNTVSSVLTSQGER